MAQVFISYAREDTDTMQTLRDDLRSRGFEVWTDEALTHGSPSWKEAVEREIEDAECLVVVLSPDAKQSKWVEREIAYASEFRTGLVPVLVRGEVRDAVPIEIINTQRVDARQDYPSALDAVVQAVTGLVGRGPMRSAPAAARLAMRQIGVLSLYAGNAHSVSFSPDGNLLAVGTQKSDVQVWDVMARQKVADLEGHTEFVNSVAFGPDGTLASGSGDGTVRVWDVNKREEFQRYRKPGLRLFKSSQDVVNSVEWSPDGRLVVSTSQEAAAWLWHTHIMKPFHRLGMDEAQQPMLGATFHPTEEIVAVGGWAGFIGIFNWRSGERLSMVGQKEMTRDLAFSPNGKLLAVAARDALIHLYDVPSWNKLGALEGHERAHQLKGPFNANFPVCVQSIAFSTNGRWLASVADDSRLIVWDVSQGRPAITMPWTNPGASGPGSKGVAWRPDGKLLAATAEHSSVQLFSID